MAFGAAAESIYWKCRVCWSPAKRVTVNWTIKGAMRQVHGGKRLAGAAFEDGAQAAIERPESRMP
jgi:hypothetical protein